MIKSLFKFIVFLVVIFFIYSLISDSNSFNIINDFIDIPEDKRQSSVLGLRDLDDLEKIVTESDKFVGDPVASNESSQQDETSIEEDNFNLLEDLKNINLKDLLDTENISQNINGEESGTERNYPSEDNFLDNIENLPTYTAACFPTMRQSCVVGECENEEIDSSFILLNKEEDKIMQCNGNECREINSTFSISNNFEIYQPVEPEGVIITKEINEEIERTKASFLEIKVEGFTTKFKYGYCLGQ